MEFQSLSWLFLRRLSPRRRLRWSCSSSIHQHRGSLLRSHGNRPVHITGHQEGVDHGRRAGGGRREERQEPEAPLHVRVPLLEEAGGQLGQEEREESDPQPAGASVHQPGGPAQQREHPENAPNRGEEAQSADPGAGAHGAHAEQRGRGPEREREALRRQEAAQQPVSGVASADSHPGFHRRAAALLGGLYVPQVFQAEGAEQRGRDPLVPQHRPDSVAPGLAGPGLHHAGERGVRVPAVRGHGGGQHRQPGRAAGHLSDLPLPRLLLHGQRDLLPAQAVHDRRQQGRVLGDVAPDHRPAERQNAAAERGPALFHAGLPGPEKPARQQRVQPGPLREDGGGKKGKKEGGTLVCFFLLF